MDNFFRYFPCNWRNFDRNWELFTDLYVDEILNPTDSSMMQSDGEGLSGEKDPLYDEAVEIVLRTRKASISYVQRNLRIGYNRAARIIEDMEKAGLVTPMQSNGNREIVAPNND